LPLTEWAPATEAEAAMLDALRASDQERYFRILARIELVLPVAADAVAGRAAMGWATWTSGNRTHVLGFTSPAALHACLGASASTFRAVPFPELAADWPNFEWWLAINPGLPIESYLPSWFVSQLNRGEVRLPGRATGAGARMARSDLAAAVSGRARVSAPTARATMPVPPRREPMLAATIDAEVDFDELDRLEGRGYVLETVDAEIIDPEVIEPEVIEPEVIEPEVVEPEPSLGESLAAYQAELREAELRDERASHTATMAAQPGPRPPADAPTFAAAKGARAAGFVPANQTESNLLAAAEEGNTDQFLSTLLLARVIVPVPYGTPAASRPTDRSFPWQVGQVDGQPYLAVFTSPERLAEHGPTHAAGEVSSVSMRFVQLIAAWPDEKISFSINPGSPVGATLPGDQVRTLATWAAEMGLRDEAAADLVVPARPADAASPSHTGVAGAPVVGADKATVMQRAIPPAQLPFYLDRGYDRVSGFVHRATEVAHLTSPRLLYRALGLDYAGSPFHADDGEVHVLRWVAHRADLYRIPYGGQHEAGMRAMQGWVVERSPFRGNGFAPGDSGEIISEFKVDSVRLPHGAQIWRLRADGTQTLVATFDADWARWQRAVAEAAATDDWAGVEVGAGYGGLGGYGAPGGAGGRRA
jgi:SseB protein N-terminal domain